MKHLPWQWLPLLINKDLNSHHQLLLRGTSLDQMLRVLSSYHNDRASGYDEDEALARAVAASLQEEEKEKQRRPSHRQPQQRHQRQQQQQVTKCTIIWLFIVSL